MTVRSLVATGNHKAGQAEYFAEWTETLPSMASARKFAAGCLTTADQTLDTEGHAYTDKDGAWCLDLGGPVVDARQRCAAQLAAIDSALASLNAARVLVADGLDGWPGMLAARNALVQS